MTSLRRRFMWLVPLSMLIMPCCLAPWELALTLSDTVVSDTVTEDNVYGPHERNIFDFYKATSDSATPVVLYFHGGAFNSGDKSLIPHALVLACLREGISVASVNYRLSHDASFPAPMRDAALAVQYLREHAATYNIDPDRVATMGNSAGGGIALWVALYDDLADPNSADPVLRQSTRVHCAAGIAAQTSYDPRWIKAHIGGQTAEHPALLELFGLTEDDRDSELAIELYEMASPINHVSADDPPVFLLYNGSTEPPRANAPPSAGVHHPLFGEFLKAAMNTVGAEVVLHHRDDYVTAGGNSTIYADLAAFLSDNLAD